MDPNEPNPEEIKSIAENLAVALTYVYALSYESDIDKGLDTAQAVSENISMTDLLQGLSSLSAVLLTELAVCLNLTVEELIETLRIIPRNL